MPARPTLEDILTRREKVAAMVAEGLTDVEIGAQLSVHIMTVRRDREALGLANAVRVQAAAKREAIAQRAAVRDAPDPRLPADTLATEDALVALLGWKAADDNPWRDAVCAQVDPDLFHPHKGQSPREARRICANCPLTRIEDGGNGFCLEQALAGNEFGVWAGTTERQRRRMTRRAA